MKKNVLICSMIFLLIGLNTGFAREIYPQTDTVRVWSGLTDTDWFLASNWEGAIVPSDNDVVVIPSNLQRYPVLGPNEYVICNGLTINDVGDFDKMPSGGRMVVSGDFYIDGSLTIKVGGFLDITDGGSLTITENLKNSGSMIIENGGSLITGGTVTGLASVIREFPNDLGWHLISSPVDYQEICNGSFAPLPSNFATTPANTWDFYKWSADCPIEPLLRWRNLRNLDLSVNTADFGTAPKFDVQKGYLAAYNPGFSTTKTFYGTPNTGDQTFNFLDVTSNCSWELAGNPYPSAFVWDDVAGKGNLMSGYYYVWNELRAGSPGYEAYLDGAYHSTGVNGNIPPMQGFFVKVDPSKSKQIDVPNSSRIHDSNHWLKNTSVTPSNQLIITMGTATVYDEAYIIFGTNGSLGKDWYDAEKMFSINNQVPQVYTIVDNDLKTLINAMPFTNYPVSIPVGIITPNQGTFSFKVTGFDSFTSFPGLSLEDLKLNTSQNMVANPVYSFTADGNEDASRFLLHFSGPIGISEKNTSTINIYSNEKTVFINNPAGFHNAQVSVSNLLGQEILTRKLSDQNLNQINVNALKGYYIVKVQTESSVQTAKVYIN